jgi:uncharacterized membrane protein
MRSGLSRPWGPRSWCSAVSWSSRSMCRACSALRGPGAYETLRRQLGRCILLGLEVLIVADIVLTIIVEQTFKSVAVLGVIVIVRILLSFSLEVEMDGMWPWNRWRRAEPDAGS